MRSKCECYDRFSSFPFEAIDLFVWFIFLISETTNGLQFIWAISTAFTLIDSEEKQMDGSEFFFLGERKKDVDTVTE